MDISMDIHETSVDVDMDMDVIFHIHGNPAYYLPYVLLIHFFWPDLPASVLILPLGGICCFCTINLELTACTYPLS